MDGALPQPTRISWLDATVEYARRQPGKALVLLCVFHMVVWTVLPLLLCPNLQLDLAEGLSLGREWQLGYWKHPPLPWWTDELVYRLTGNIHSVYLLGALSSVLCFYGVWLLARDTVGGFRGLIAVAVLEGVHFYNFSTVKFAHDQMQLPFWAFTAWFMHRALTRHRALDWLLAGVFLAGAFWAKYAAFALAVSLGLFLLFDPTARRAWRTAGPYLMAAAFLVVIAPNAWWLVSHDFMPFNYVSDRARLATRWYHYAVFPLRWTGSQLLNLLPTLAVMALLYRRGEAFAKAPDVRAAFDRRYVATLALAPFAVVTVVFGLLGRLPVAMWSNPLWSFVPLAILLWWPPADDRSRLRRLAAGVIAVTIAFPLIYAAVEIGEPLLRDRPKATQFAGQAMADTITRAWHDRFGTNVPYVGGIEFFTNCLAVYSPDHPHVIPHADPALSPWVDPDDLRRRGAVLVWAGEPNAPDVAKWHERYGAFSTEPPLALPRQTLLGRVKPDMVYYGFVAPKP